MPASRNAEVLTINLHRGECYRLKGPGRFVVIRTSSSHAAQVSRVTTHAAEAAPAIARRAARVAIRRRNALRARARLAEIHRVWNMPETPTLLSEGEEVLEDDDASFAAAVSAQHLSNMLAPDDKSEVQSEVATPPPMEWGEESLLMASDVSQASNILQKRSCRRK